MIKNSLKILVSGLMICWAAVPGFAQTVAEVTHREFQAVAGNGVGTYVPENSDKVILTGVLLNNPEEMLDVRPSAPGDSMGGQWQVFIQPVDPCDHAGTAIWHGQNYGSGGPGTIDYTDVELMQEQYRLNHDSNTGHVFRIGDRVKVTGWYKFFKGKNNINEQHQTDPTFNIEIELLEAGYGLPLPEVVALDELKDADDDYIFDYDRLEGCEYYQGRLVRLNDVTITNPGAWGQQSELIVNDGAGRTFPVYLGQGLGFVDYDCPTGLVDVIGILNQENSTFTPPYKDGYHLWVCDYDNNGSVLADFGRFKNHLEGDINLDGVVNLVDVDRLVRNWLMSR